MNHPADSELSSEQHSVASKSQRRKWVLWMGTVVFVAGLVALAAYRMDAMQRRVQQISIGAPRQQVEQTFGPPHLTLNRSAPATGEMLVWTDMFWQVDIAVDGEGRVEKLRCVPANSAYRRTQTWLQSLLK